MRTAIPDYRTDMHKASPYCSNRLRGGVGNVIRSCYRNCGVVGNHSKSLGTLFHLPEELSVKPVDDVIQPLVVAVLICFSLIILLDGDGPVGFIEGDEIVI